MGSRSAISPNSDADKCRDARVDIDDVSRNYVPYLMALLIGLALIAAFPFFTLVLPRLVMGYK